MSDFKFEFSLEVLNHLGRGLYRNFATVVAEAISNSWDAEATEVRITINKEKKEMSILDNGNGMNSDDFQNKFLRVGYSRREDKDNTSKRKVLGRKGIGKLAMLSISKKVTAISKKRKCSLVGGVIDNTELDEKIKDDGNYNLGDISEKLESEIGEFGTYIKFEDIKPSVNNPEIIKKYIAVMFSFLFSFPTEKFLIYVNDSEVGDADLFELNDLTQFLWCVDIDKKSEETLHGRFTEIKSYGNLSEYSFEANHKNHQIKGFIASVRKPAHLKIHGTGGDFKAGLHLFVNGRLRQEDVFKDIASQRVVESYLYGEIHVDGFDEGDDIFTSNREGIVKDSEEYIVFLEKLKEIQKIILKNWDEWRNELVVEIINTNEGEYGDLKSDKKKAINTFIKAKEDDDLKGKFRVFLDKVIPKSSDKKILISHTSADKHLADIVYKKLIKVGFDPGEIIYTSSTHKNSKLPVGTDIFKYIRDFFVQNWRDNPHVFFVVSADMEKSWFASLEAGAAWVTQTKHTIATTNDYDPRDPLETSHVHIRFDKNNDFKDEVQADMIFEDLADQYNITP